LLAQKSDSRAKRTTGRVTLPITAHAKRGEQMIDSNCISGQRSIRF
jgi:hypothetical protein